MNKLTFFSPVVALFPLQVSEIRFFKISKLLNAEKQKQRMTTSAVQVRDEMFFS